MTQTQKTVPHNLDGGAIPVSDYVWESIEKGGYSIELSEDKLSLVFTPVKVGFIYYNEHRAIFSKAQLAHFAPNSTKELNHQSVSFTTTIKFFEVGKVLEGELPDKNQNYIKVFALTNTPYESSLPLETAWNLLYCFGNSGGTQFWDNKPNILCQ
jgi:hypothetical protein